MQQNQPQPHIVVLSGAGISAESGLKTFQGNDGLWENHNMDEVASLDGWEANPQLVLDFYNTRRRQLATVEPNPAHHALVELEAAYHVSIITQNIDNLHERAGSGNILHIHGELDLARSSADEALTYPLHGKDIKLGDSCELGSQLRPHVVWFGESVWAMADAERIIKTADLLIVIGTSLGVYPASELAYSAPKHAAKYLINLEIPESIDPGEFTCVTESASTALPKLVNALLSASD